MSEPTRRRVVIFGFPRSGTTLLARLLDGHPEISAPPETSMLSAAGRFLTELAAVEGPPVGVLTGLAMAGIPPADVHAALRDMIFGFHERIAAGATVWVEKTATDIFHLETLEPFLAGHAGFVCITRNPLDVVASNIDLARTLGAQLTELFSVTRGTNAECDGIARAWVDRQQALDAFVARNAGACFSLRYEDLLADPQAMLARLLAFIGLKGDPAAMIAAAFSPDARIGLGDFRIDETTGLRPAVEGGWRKRLPRAAAARILPQLAPLMEAHGYAVPRLPPPPDRDTAIRQFQLATQMKRQTRVAAQPKPNE
jgi:LPS sulfotransferase NodH